MIVKVQMPLSDPNADLLVYPKGKRPTWLLPQTEALRSALGDDLKAYFEATVVAGQVKIGQRVAPQPW